MLAAELALHLQQLGAPPQLLHVAGRFAPGSFVEADENVGMYVDASEEVLTLSLSLTLILTLTSCNGARRGRGTSSRCSRRTCAPTRAPSGA